MRQPLFATALTPLRRPSRSGLDVDKLDYFQRDARNSVGVRSVDLDRFIELARCVQCYLGLLGST